MSRSRVSRPPGSLTQPASLWLPWAWDLSTNHACGTSPAPRTFTIPSRLTPNVRRVVDMYGQQVTLKRSSDSLSCPLGRAACVYRVDAMKRET